MFVDKNLQMTQKKSFKRCFDQKRPDEVLKIDACAAVKHKIIFS